jgi:hypothetical protein
MKSNGIIPIHEIVKILEPKSVTFISVIPFFQFSIGLRMPHAGCRARLARGPAKIVKLETASKPLPKVSVRPLCALCLLWWAVVARL